MSARYRVVGRALELAGRGSPLVVNASRAFRGRLGSSEVLLRVQAASVNPLDWIMQNGYGEEFLLPGGRNAYPVVLGRDCCGRVVQAGDGVWDLAEGDEVVMANSPLNEGGGGGGCFADYVVCSAAHVAPKPAALSAVDAASLPYASLTAWSAIYGSAGVMAGQSVLVHGAAGGVGAAAVQILKGVLGCHVLATCSGAALDACRNLGADLVVDYETQDFAEAIGHGACDAVLDFAGGAQPEEKSFSVLRPGGHYVTMSGAFVHNTEGGRGILCGAFKSVSDLARKKWQCLSSPARIQYSWGLFHANGKALAEIMQLAQDGVLTPRVAATFPLEHGQQAIDFAKDGRKGTGGKVVLELAG